MKFRTTILQGGKTATGIEVPESVMEALGAGRKPAVRVTIGDYTYRSSVATVDGKSMVGVSAEHRAGAGVAGGDEVDVNIELDTEPRTVTVPDELAAALDAESGGARDLRPPLLQQSVVARPPGHRRQDRGDSPASDRALDRGTARGPPALRLSARRPPGLPAPPPSSPGGWPPP